MKLLPPPHVYVQVNDLFIDFCWKWGIWYLREDKTRIPRVSKRDGRSIWDRRIYSEHEIGFPATSFPITFKYADPLLDQLDPNNLITARFYREHCTFYNKVYVKDLRKLGRNPKNIIFIDVRKHKAGVLYGKLCYLELAVIVLVLTWEWSADSKFLWWLRWQRAQGDNTIS